MLQNVARPFVLSRARAFSLSIYLSLSSSLPLCVCVSEVDDTHTLFLRGWWHTHTHTHTHIHTHKHKHTHTYTHKGDGARGQLSVRVCQRYLQNCCRPGEYCFSFFSERLNSFLFTERLMNILLEKNKYYYEKIMYRIFFFQSASFLFFSQSASFLLGKKISLWKNDIWLLFCRAPHFCSFHRWCGAAYGIQATSFSYYYHKYYYKKILYRMLFLLLWIGGVGLPTELKLHLSQIIITHIIIKNIM